MIVTGWYPRTVGDEARLERVRTMDRACKEKLSESVDHDSSLH